MTDFTIRKLKELESGVSKIIANAKSNPDYRISKRDLAIPMECIFDIIKSGDLDFKVNLWVASEFHKMFRRWIYS